MFVGDLLKIPFYFYSKSRNFYSEPHTNLYQYFNLLYNFSLYYENPSIMYCDTLFSTSIVRNLFHSCETNADFVVFSDIFQCGWAILKMFE